MKKIRVKFEGGEHSAGRGVGFYRNNLGEALSKLDGIEIVETNPDLVHYPFFDLFYPTLPGKLDLPTIVTIHDLTPLVLKQLYPQGFRGSVALMAQKRALKNVAAVLTDSLSSKNDIVRLFRLSAKDVFVTPLAANIVYAQKPSASFLKAVKAKYRLPDRFLLYVGGVNPNKNLVRLAKAAISLNLPLVLVGSEFVKATLAAFSFKKLLGLQKIHPEVRAFNQLQALIADNPLFLTPGFVSSDDLNAIYRLAALYVQPSLYEGFGLPLLEAMTAGCPIIAANTGSLPEIMPAESLTFDPYSQQSIETAISDALALSAKDKQRLIKLGQSKAKDFSWDKTARATLAVYQKVLHGVYN